MTPSILLTRRHAMGLFAAVLADPVLANTAWADTLSAARGQTVYFNAWAGSERINA